MKKQLITLIFALIGVVAMAQNITVTGVVTSKTDGEPLIGATVRVKGSNNACITDLDGKYSIANVARDAVLSFNYVGFKPMDVPVKGNSVINVSLEESSTSLDEVVVVGYGAVKRSDLTSSITTVKGDEITEVTTGNAMDALQGKLSGVQVVSGGGPGTTPKVLVRGITSANNTNPLYVVDGVPLNSNNINFLNSNDIESMEVLKDASASAIYGTRASNGVIIITTKKGKSGKTQIDFSASVGFQTIAKPKIAGADEYEKVFKARYMNDNRVPAWNSPYENYSDVDGTDWWDQVINKTALVQNYSLSIRGGNDKFVYSLGVGYFRNNSQYDFGYWDKLNVRLNTEYIFNKYVKAGIDLAPNMETWEGSPNLFADAQAMDPTTPVFRPESEWDSSNPMNNYQRSYNNMTWNPAGNLARMNGKSTKMGLLMNPYVQINPINGLTFRTQFGLNAWFQRNDGYGYKFKIDALEQSQVNSDYRNYSNEVDWNWSNTLTYNNTFAEKHNLTVMAGFEAQRFAYYWANASREDIPGNSDLLHEVGAGTGTQFANGNTEYQTLASFMGRLMYNFDNRYYITASIRTDGSSRFPKGNKYGTFPSVSAAWRLSEEAFMEGTRGWLSNAKIRLGWGRVGNQTIGNGKYISTMGNLYYIFGNTPSLTPGVILGTYGNNHLKWETVEDMNLGIDASILNNRLNVTFDIYQKTSHDMLYDKQNLLLSGYPQWNAAVTTNIGKMRARGWELAINWNDNVGDFSYNIGLQLSGVQNKGIKFTGDGPVLDGNGQAEKIIRNDDDALISRFYGYNAAGLFQNWEEVYAHTDEHGNLIQPSAQPGDIRFLDLNHDGRLNEDDKSFIGNPYPDLMMGLNIGLNYKNFDFIANFYGTFGNDIYNLQKKAYYSGDGGANVHAGTLDKAWHGAGTSNDIPRLSYSDLNQNYSRVSSFYVEKGDYFRCKLLTLGYTLPKHLLAGNSLRVYVSAQNLFTITKYTGMDPERPLLDGGPLATGIDHASYPSPRTFLLGLDFKF